MIHCPACFVNRVPPTEYTAKVWGEAGVPRGRTALTEEPGIGYTGGAWSYWSK